jgi:hypothetical protein
MRHMGSSGVGRGGSRMVRAAFAAARQPTPFLAQQVWDRYNAQTEALKADNQVPPHKPNEPEE